VAIDAAGTTDDATFGLDARGRIASRAIGSTTDTYRYLGTGEAVTTISTGGLSSVLDAGGSRLGVRDAE
jgi:hypothetical protein